MFAVSRTTIFRESAEQELREAYEWYEATQLGLGDQLLGEIDGALALVVESPEL